MTDESSPKPTRPNPARKPGGPSQKKPGARPAQKKKPASDPLEMIKKVPLPILGGVAAFAVMVLYVVGTAMMAPVPGQPAPVEQVQEATSVPVAETAATSPETPAAESTESAIPSYVGPKERLDEEVVSTALPMISRVGDDLKQLGREVKMSKKEYEDQSQLYDTFDLDGDPFLAYRVRLPKSWQFMGPRELKDMQLNNRLMGIMAYYVSPADLELRSSFRLKAQRMAHMMSARDWTYHYALANRYTLQAMTTYGDDRAEAVYVITEMDISYVVRMAVVVSGPRVVIAEYFVPMQKYEEEQDLQTWGITSFYLKKKDLSSTEPTKTLYFFDIASTVYPESWIVENPNIVSVDQMSASVVNLQQEDRDKTSLLRGRVDVFLFAADDTYNEKAAFDTINELFEPQQLKLGKKLGRFIPTDNQSGLKGESYTVYSIENPEHKFQDYQYWVTVMKGKNYYFYVCLLSPPRDTDVYNWSRNLGAFEYMVKTMKEGV